MIIAVDFDGTLCEYMNSGIGEPKYDVINKVKELAKDNWLILWTCRTGEALNDALNWCKQYGLTFNSVNENVPWAHPTSNKIYADLYLDDKSVNIEEFLKGDF